MPELRDSFSNIVSVSTGWAILTYNFIMKVHIFTDLQTCHNLESEYRDRSYESCYAQVTKK